MKYINKKHLVALSILFAFGLVGITAWSSVQSENVERVIIENKTRSLQVEAVKELGSTGNISKFEISLRNNYDKPVSIYRFRVSDKLFDKDAVTAIEQGGFLDKWLIKPNETSVSKFSANSKGKVFLTIVAVLFEDGTGDGNAGDVIRLQEIRTGVFMGFKEIVPILQESAKADESLSSEAMIQSLEERIKQINDKDIPDNLKRGFAQAKSYVSLELKDVRENISLKPNFNPRADVIDKLVEIESALTKLTVNLPSNIGKKRRQNED